MYDMGIGPGLLDQVASSLRSAATATGLYHHMDSGVSYKHRPYRHPPSLREHVLTIPGPFQVLLGVAGGPAHVQEGDRGRGFRDERRHGEAAGRRVESEGGADYPVDFHSCRQTVALLHSP